MVFQLRVHDAKGLAIKSDLARFFAGLLKDVELIRSLHGHLKRAFFQTCTDA